MSGWRDSRIQRAALSVLAGAAVAVVATIGRTLRWRVDGLEHLAFGNPGALPIMAFWHSRIMPAMYYFRHRRIRVMVSENFSGEWMTRTSRRFGYDTARGSSGSGARALDELADSLARGQVVGIAVDGPRGPARAARRGVVRLARASGRRVVPFHLEASRSWTAGSWDRTMVPWPFATVALVVAPPITVAADADEAALEAARAEVEQALRDLERRATALLH